MIVWKILKFQIQERVWRQKNACVVSKIKYIQQRHVT